MCCNVDFCIEVIAHGIACYRLDDDALVVEVAAALVFHTLCSCLK